MIDRTTKLKLLELEDLPTLPEVVTQILRITDDDLSSAHELGTAVEMDHVISAHVLQIANSAFYGLAHKVETVRAAVVVLGFDTVRSLALATSVFGAFHKAEQFALNPRDFWLHSLGAAKAAHLLAKNRTGLATPASLFTAGLMHDLGKYVLALALHEEYGRAVRMAREEDIPLEVVERRILATTHAEVGAWLAERWHFPPIFVDCIEHLYSYASNPGPFAQEAALIALADMLSRVAGFGSAGDPNPQGLPDDLLDRLDLSQQCIVETVETMVALRDDTERLLDILAGNNQA